MNLNFYNKLLDKQNEIIYEIRQTKETIEFTTDETHLVFWNDYLEELNYQKSLIKIQIYEL